MAIDSEQRKKNTDNKENQAADRAFMRGFDIKDNKTFGTGKPLNALQQGARSRARQADAYDTGAHEREEGNTNSGDE